MRKTACVCILMTFGTLYQSALGLASTGQVMDRAAQHVAGVGKAGLVEVTLLDAKTLSPLPGAKVYLYNASWRNNEGGLTDGTGITRIKAPVGQYKAYASAGGYTTGQFPEPIVIETGHTCRVEAMLDPRFRLQGRVLTVERKPVAHAMVTVHPFGDHVYTDASGRFEAGCDDQRMINGGFVVARDIKNGLASVMAVKTNTQPVDVTVRSAWTLTGRITDLNGGGIPEARVSLRFHSHNCLSGLDMKVLTDAEGRYEFPAVPPVVEGFVYRMSVNVAEFGPVKFRRISPVGDPGQSVDLGLIALLRTDQSVTGRVVDANGTPVPSMPVFVLSLDGVLEKATNGQ